LLVRARCDQVLQLRDKFRGSGRRSGNPSDALLGFMQTTYAGR
jgi:hypothetical protein